MIRISSLALIVVAAVGCASSRTDTVAVVQKYSAPPAKGHWGLVDDSQQFWRDVGLLHAASLRGDPDAMRTILVIGIFADGAVSESMPDLSETVKKHPETGRQIIYSDNRLEAKYSRWAK
jgi:hypothetical protein